MKIPSKIIFFMWTVCRDRLPTIDLLQRRGRYLPNVCSLCYKDEETSAHVVPYCEYAYEVWCLAFKEVGLSWVSQSCFFLSHLILVHPKHLKKSKIYEASCSSSYLLVTVA